MSETKTAEAAIEKAEQTSVALVAGAVVPHTLDESLRVAKWALESRLLPTDVTSVAAAWAVMQRGAELGFTPLGAFDFLYVVNGRVRMTPDAVKAKAYQSGLLEDAREEIAGEGESMVARVTVKRRGLPTPVIGEFSVTDAKRAKLWIKGGSWSTYPQRMLKARARGFAYGDAFKDLCGGLPVRERFDLDPGEALGEASEPLGRRAEQPRLPPSSPDPLLAELSGTEFVKNADVEVADPPPFPSHAEADKAIAETEGGAKKGRLF